MPAPEAVWQRSTKCASSTCVEIRRSGRAILIRDSKNPSGPMLAFPLERFGALMHQAKAGRLDDFGAMP